MTFVGLYWVWSDQSNLRLTLKIQIDALPVSPMQFPGAVEWSVPKVVAIAAHRALPMMACQLRHGKIYARSCSPKRDQGRLHC